MIELAEKIAVQGLAPAMLNSLEKLANALHGDANYFQTVTTAIGNKADKSTTYTKTQADALLDAKVDGVEKQTTPPQRRPTTNRRR